MLKGIFKRKAEVSAKVTEELHNGKVPAKRPEEGHHGKTPTKMPAPPDIAASTDTAPLHEGKAQAGAPGDTTKTALQLSKARAEEEQIEQEILNVKMHAEKAVAELHQQLEKIQQQIRDLLL